MVDRDGKPGMKLRGKEGFRDSSTFIMRGMIAYSRHGEVRTELAGIRLYGDLSEGSLDAAVGVLKGCYVPVQADPQDTGTLGVGIRTDVSQPERERANRFDGVGKGIDYRVDLPRVHVAEELEREMHVFGSDGLQSANSGLCHLFSEMTQSGSHVVRELDG